MRHVRVIATVLATVTAAACSNDPMGPSEPQASVTDTATSTAIAPAAPSFDLSVPAGMNAAEAATFNTLSGTLTPGGPWNLRSGPGVDYSIISKGTSGTAVSVVCTATRLNADGASVVWNRLATGSWVANSAISVIGVAPACDSPEGPKVAAGLRGNDYPYATAGYANCPHDPWGFCTRQCTSFVAWRLRSVNGLANFRYGMNFTPWGNAGQWASTARTLGYRVDKKPEVGAVAQWNASSGRPVGHVAWVASVSADGSQVTIEEYNSGVKYGYGKRTLSASSIDNFVHLY